VRSAGAQTLARISEAVLLTAAALAPSSDSEATAELLYHGNWLPLSPSWLSRFPDEEAVMRFVVGDGSAAALLDSRWLRTRDRSWTHWNAGNATRVACPFKVYVSVAPDELPAAFERWVEVLTVHGTCSFKLSRHPRGLLRPDRLVAYCATRAETETLVSALETRLVGLAAQGVPFTAAMVSPAVSWARDPPPSVNAFAPSWRRWVARKLAAYLHASDSADTGARRAFACARLREDGVDTDMWSPSSSLWEPR
jgi:hypothetical protein